MKKHLIVLTVALLATGTLHAANLTHDDELEGGLLTSFANRAMERAMKPQPADSIPMRKRFGRDLTDWVSAPKIGAYYTGGYKYSNEEGKHGGPGFTTRLIRAYVSGTLLKHVDYRLQMELQNTVHLKDAYIEYRQFRPARIKMGQFKRPFGFENPMNPWDVGLADYSQLTKKMMGFSDHTVVEYNGNNGGRDLGLQVQGDFLSVGRNGKTHPLFHYQAGVFNGQGINTTDANGAKDLIGTFQLQPVKDLYIGVFAWSGSYRSQGVTAYRRRWAAGLNWNHKGWLARTEYAHHRGLTLSDIQTLPAEERTYHNRFHHGEAQAWYALLGVPCTPWMNIVAKWDCYTPAGPWSDRNEILSLSPNFRLHKDLMFNLQWNFVNNHLTHRNHHELWAMAWVRI